MADTVALIANGGYEANEQSSREVLIDATTGLPVTDSNGGFVGDKSKPRKLTYDQKGLTASVGVIWRPSHRTRLEARVGRRYGGLSYSGLLEMQPSDKTTLNVIVSDRINSFGRAVTSGLASPGAARSRQQRSADILSDLPVRRERQRQVASAVRSVRRRRPAIAIVR